MIDNYRVVIVVPAGRKQYLEILLPQFKKYIPVVDEIRIWVNTTNQSDIEYMKQFYEENKESMPILLEYSKVPVDGTNTICNFFKNCCDPNTVYVRFDDDILMIDTLESFIEFVQFRIAHPEYFIVYGCIVNNNLINHILQRNGKIAYTPDKYDYICMGEYWKSGQQAERVHRQVIEKYKKNNTLCDLRLYDNWILYYYERVSINCIAFLGKEFATFQGNVGRDEEDWLSCTKPREINKPNVIYGKFSVVHYAFYTQRAYLDNTDCLAQYKKLLMP